MLYSKRIKKPTSVGWLFLLPGKSCPDGAHAAIKKRSSFAFSLVSSFNGVATVLSTSILVALSNLFPAHQ